MKKLLISNIVTVVVVLGILAAYSFSKPDVKGGAKYAFVRVTSNHPFINIVETVDGKSDHSTIKTNVGMKITVESDMQFQSEVYMKAAEKLNFLETQGYQLIGTTRIRNNNIEVENEYVLRKP